MEVRFYRCNHCGNIMMPVADAGVSPFCCGDRMELLKEGQVDAAVEKHVPVIERDDDGKRVTVKVGSAPHPMTDEHYIQFLVLVYGARIYCHRFTPGDEPQARFSVKDNSVPLAAYEYCNLHGLWNAEV